MANSWDVAKHLRLDEFDGDTTGDSLPGADGLDGASGPPTTANQIWIKDKKFPSAYNGTFVDPFRTAEGRKYGVSVVKNTDANRGFRLFDNAVFTVKDVSSEELFLERMEIAYDVYNKHLDDKMNIPLTDLATLLLVCTKICICNYFCKQSMTKSNRPFIVTAEYLDCSDPSLFCAGSDFIRAFLYTKPTSDPFLEQDIYEGDNNDVSYDLNTMDKLIQTSVQKALHEAISQDPGMDEHAKRMKKEELTMHYITTVMNNAFVNNSMRPEDVLKINADYTKTSSTIKETDQSEAVLYMVADVKAIANMLCYMFYMTPIDLRRRYNVELGCNQSKAFQTASADRFTAAARACCDDATKMYKNQDSVRRAVNEFLLQKRTNLLSNRPDVINQLKVNLPGVDPRLVEALNFDKKYNAARSEQIVCRKRELLKAFLLLLFDKSLSAIIDNGFDNVNKKRRYGLSSKAVGGATVYTGIIDTVGKVSLRRKDSDFIAGKLSYTAKANKRVASAQATTPLDVSQFDR